MRKGVKDMMEYTQCLDGFQVVRCEVMETGGIPEDGLSGLARLSVRDGRKRTLNVWVERRGPCRCPLCGSAHVSEYAGRERSVRGLMEGGCPTVIHFTPHVVYCRACRARKTERVPFLSRPKARLTEALERTVVALRGEMTISAIADYYDLDWETVKDTEKRSLAREYGDVPLDRVTAIGIDEIQAFPGAKGAANQFVTVARELRTGAVLCVADGKGSEALRAFGERLAPFRENVEFVCMDMSNAYEKWAREFLPRAEVVFDHFHLVKAMNEKVNSVRRRAAAGMDAELRKAVKGCRRILTANAESLDGDGKARLAAVRGAFGELSDAYAMKEMLRGIYSFASIEYSARLLLEDWCETARMTKVPELESMARTVESHLEGILGYWRHAGASNASSEGFNTKIRRLIQQAYGLRDREYFRLKVFALPKQKARRGL